MPQIAAEILMPAEPQDSQLLLLLPLLFTVIRRAGFPGAEMICDVPVVVVALPGSPMSHFVVLEHPDTISWPQDIGTHGSTSQLGILQKPTTDVGVWGHAAGQCQERTGKLAASPNHQAALGRLVLAQGRFASPPL